jgi:predicted amino acid racemase
MTRLSIDRRKISRNFAVARGECARRGVRLTLVSKLVRSRPEILGTLLEEGLESIADSNQCSLSPWVGRVSTTLLRYAGDALEARFDRVHASSLGACRELSLTGSEAVVTVELGDLREGVTEEEFPSFLDALAECGVKVYGLAANLGCLSGRLLDAEALASLARMRGVADERLRRSGTPVSIGGTVAWGALASGALDGAVDELRLGEAVFFGNDMSHRERLEGFEYGAFVLSSRVLEVREKAPLVHGTYGYDAFGLPARASDVGARLRAVLDFGEAIASWKALECAIPGARLVGATHEYTVLDVTDAAVPVREGDEVDFVASYNAAAHAFSSQDVKVQFR